jgi:Flp pilus assembly protein TadG
MFKRRRKMKARNTRRGTKGNCFIECCLGGALLIPIALCMLDLGSIVLAAELNDTAARQAARSAANEQTQTLAYNAAQLAVEAYAPNQLTSYTLDNVNYTTGDSVTVQTSVDVKVPFQFPFLSERTLVAQVTMPVIATNQ